MPPAPLLPPAPPDPDCAAVWVALVVPLAAVVLLAWVLVAELALAVLPDALWLASSGGKRSCAHETTPITASRPTANAAFTMDRMARTIMKLAGLVTVLAARNRAPQKRGSQFARAR